jgi:hypothetical protein
MVVLNKFLYLTGCDCRMIWNASSFPADGFRLNAKFGRILIVTVESMGHHIEFTKSGTEILGLVLRDQTDALWQARYEVGRYESGFQDEVRGFVKFTRVTESTQTLRVFTEVF